MSASHANPESRSEGSSRQGSRGFFKWFPWEKLTIWALFLLVVYVLRDFFAVIFLTFIFSYIMTNLVRRTLNVLSLKEKKGEILVHRVLTCIYFVVFILSLWGVAVFLKDPFETQIRRLVTQFKEFRPQTFVEDLLRDTVGSWQFNQEYAGDQGEEKRKTDLEEFRNEQYGKTAFQRFSNFRDHVRGEFVTAFKTEAGKAKFDELREVHDAYLEELRAWIGNSRARDLYSRNAADWNERFRKSYTEYHGPSRYDSLASNPEKFEEERTGWVLDHITEAEFEKVKQRRDPPPEFIDHLGTPALAELESDDELFNTEFKEFYENQRTRRARDPIYSWDQFRDLSAAFVSSQEAFYRTLMAHISEMDPEDRERRIAEDFERLRKAELVAEVLVSWNFDLKDINDKITGVVPAVGARVGGAGIYVFNFMVQFLLSLMLSFFITFDLPRMKKGIVALQRSRAQDFYREIAPGLAAFGMLIGRAFQAQGVIAVCNTLLTFALIRALDIPFETFLCTIVFICSFIPVLGVILSSIPIAVIAFQYIGFEVAALSIGGILLIHFFETSVLNPKILGQMLHLHPVLVLGILVIGEHFFKVWGLLLGVPVMVYIIHYVILGHDITQVLRGGRGRTEPLTSPALPSDAPVRENQAAEDAPPEPVAVSIREDAENDAN